jgi:hypothetical protein
VVATAAGIRLAAYASVKDGPLVQFHRWTESDMHFFHVWAREIAAGDVLTERAGRPAHSWHDNLAREAHEAAGSSEPYDERRRLLPALR